MDNLQISLTVINQWRQDYQTLHNILSDEQLALQHRDFDQLTQSTRDKDETVKLINQHQLPALIDHQQQKITSFNQFRLFCVNSPELKPNWDSLMSVVRQCAYRNEVNARLVNLLHQSSQRTFNLIKGFDPDNNIYNATGSRTVVRHFGDSISA